MNYKIVNGTSYKEGTHPKVVSVLEQYRLLGRLYRLKITYSDGMVETGYISRSTGQVKVPLIIYRANAIGGPEISTKNIVLIEHANRLYGGVLYKREDNQ